MNDILSLKPITSKRISSEQYLNLSAREKSNIKGVQFISPGLGDKGFGFFKLSLKRPIYQSNYEQKQNT